jgi:flagellar hook assembly protein FlgD
VSLFARAVFVLLVAATFAAFFVAQRLKSAPQVAAIKSMTRHFSPNGDGRRDVSRIAVRVRKDDDVTIAIVDDADNEVRRLADAVPAKRRQSVTVRWDGRTEQGGRAPEGVYRVRVSLRRGGRAVTVGPGLRLDTTAPRPTVFAGGPDGRRWITGPVAGPVPFRVRVVSQRFPTKVRVLRTDTGRHEEVAALELPAGTREGEWDGTAGGAPAPPGTYQLVASVRDVAGNVGLSAPRQARPGTVRGQPGVSVRGLLARPPADPVRAGEPAPFAVDSRGRPFRWRMFRVGRPKPVRKGRRASGGEIELRAPRGPSGLYVLDVRTAKRSTAVPFAVQDATPAPILVVLPAITWFGRDTLDDDRDGLPNTLENGGAAAYPRLLAGGLPAGFSDQVAPLLAFLDRQKVNYDVTTDLTLAASRAGLTEERQGVLLPGPLRWVSTEVARRLRRYASDGGRVASFGADSMRRGVAVARDRLLRPLPPADSDPFGAALRPQRSLESGAAPLQPVADDPEIGLLTGVEELPGFTALEESEPSDRVRVALAALDQDAIEAAEAAGEELPPAYPALALTQVGGGTVIRVGLPEWGARLKQGAVPVQQLTRNIADILRGAEPEIRTFPPPGKSD